MTHQAESQDFSSEQLVKIIAVVQKTIGGTPIEKPVMERYLKHLGKYNPKDVIASLRKCESECKRHLSLADIVQRIPSPWPTADEAWAMCPQSESDTVVWFDELALSLGDVRHMDDRVARRRSFIDIYNRRVSEAEAEGKTPNWYPSVGQDKRMAERVLLQAAKEGKITNDHVVKITNVTARDLLPEAELKKLASGKTGPTSCEYKNDQDEMDANGRVNQFGQWIANPEYTKRKCREMLKFLDTLESGQLDIRWTDHDQRRSTGETTDGYTSAVEQDLDGTWIIIVHKGQDLVFKRKGITDIQIAKTKCQVEVCAHRVKRPPGF